MAERSARMQIESLEHAVALGDVPAMARTITEIHADWDGISEAEQKDILRLEAIFISIVKMHTQGNA